MLKEVGLENKADARPGLMSGGEQQRVAVARALIKNPPLVLADEPTGNLDTENSERVFDLMRRYNRECGTAFVVVTHDTRIADRCARVVEMIDGRIDRNGPTNQGADGAGQRTEARPVTGFVNSPRSRRPTPFGPPSTKSAPSPQREGPSTWAAGAPRQCCPETAFTSAVPGRAVTSSSARSVR